MKQLILTGAVCLALLWSVFLFVRIAQTDGFTIVISEIGAYEATGLEWIEITNVSDDVIDLTDWKFWEADTNHGMTLVQGDYFIAPDEYVIITQNDVEFLSVYPSTTASILDSSWGSLNEGGEAIAIKDADGSIVEQFTYIASPDTSLERVDLLDADYTAGNWLAHPSGNSVGAENYWYEEHLDSPEVDTLPTAVIDAPAIALVGTEVIFDASDSTDDVGIVSYEWKIANVVVGSEESLEYTFVDIGSYQIVLTIIDTMAQQASTTHVLQIISEEESAPKKHPTIRINELMTNPSEGGEWVELYRTGTSSVSLDGWTLSDGVGIIASPTGTIAAGGYYVVELTSSKLNNGGDTLLLVHGTTTVSSVTYGSWDGATVDAPEKGNTLAWDGHTYEETTTPTKGEANVFTGDTTGSSGSSESSDTISAPATSVVYSAGDIVINELVSDPADDEVEFVELYNTTETSISLDSWYLLDGSESKTPLSGQIDAHTFVVIESPKGNLNNSGDRVGLFAPDDAEIDVVTYGSWDDGNLADNAMVAADPASLARVLDGQDSDYDLYDFVVTHTITPGEPNIIASVLGDIVSADGDLMLRGNIILSEVLPNPFGSDIEGEFIELYNAGSTDIVLDGWQLGDATAARYTFAGTTIAASTYIVVYRPDTGLALNNSGGEIVTLYNPTGEIIDSTRYSASSPEGESYAKGETDWQWTSVVTPGSENVFAGSSRAPEIVIDVDTNVRVNEFVQFDASDTVDAESEALTFAWEFGDGGTGDGDVVEHVFVAEGVYTVVLTVTDSVGNKSQKEVIVTAKYSTTAYGDVAVVSSASSVQISEFLPNPEGSDSTEFIELYNPTSERIDLGDLKLDDEEGGSRGYTIPLGTVIEPGQYLVFGKQETKIALNNTSDSVRLMYPNGTIIASVDYDGGSEGTSYALTEEGDWAWTSTPTPGNPNILSAEILASARGTQSRSNYTKPVIETTLEFLRSEDIGDIVTVTGVVAVEPGVLGSQYFYIVGSPGVQVYMYKKDFPELHIGDRVRITGEISEALGETRIKLSARSDIEYIDHVGIPTPIGLDVSEIGEPYEGWLVGVDGEITELKSSYMYVDDGTAEVKVYFKRGAGIPSGTYEVGELVRVIGIISQTKDGYQLLPRSTSDITTTGMATTAVIEKQAAVEQAQAETVEKYLTATAGGLTSILLGLGIKEHGGKMRTVLLALVRLVRLKRNRT